MRISSPDNSGISPKTVVATLCLLFSLFMSGCAALRQAPVATQGPPEATALLDRLQGRNPDLSTFKGAGRMRLTDRNGRQRARIFWAARGNQKIRIEIVGPSGSPLMSFAYDGQRVYLIAHTENRFFSMARRDADLQTLIDIPIKVRSALDLMAGRVPFEHYRMAALRRESPEAQRCLVLEKGGKDKGLDKVFLAGTSDEIRRYESFDGDGGLRYRVDFHDVRQYEGFLLAGKMVFSNGGDVHMQVTMERFWPNVPVADELFVLEKPATINE